MPYDPLFLGKRLSPPTLKAGKRTKVKLDYTHFSVLFDKERKQPVYTVVNIKGRSYKPSPRKEKADKWLHDGQLDPADQLGKWFYSKTKGNFHRGHLVRRLDPCWGQSKIRAKAEADTFHFTNASPQHKEFNPRNWLELEKHILENAAVKGRQDITVFSGPVLKKKDLFYMNAIDNRYVQIPGSFWKLIVWKDSDKRLRGVCFLMSQLKLIRPLIRTFTRVKMKGLAAYDTYLQNITFKDGTCYQVSKAALEKVTGLSFNWKAVSFNYKSSGSHEVKKIRTPRPKGKRMRSGESKTVASLNVIL